MTSVAEMRPPTLTSAAPSGRSSVCEAGVMTCPSCGQRKGGARVRRSVRRSAPCAAGPSGSSRSTARTTARICPPRASTRRRRSSVSRNATSPCCCRRSSASPSASISCSSCFRRPSPATRREGSRRSSTTTSRRRLARWPSTLETAGARRHLRARAAVAAGAAAGDGDDGAARARFASRADGFRREAAIVLRAIEQGARDAKKAGDGTDTAYRGAHGAAASGPPMLRPQDRASRPKPRVR